MADTLQAACPGPLRPAPATGKTKVENPVLAALKVGKTTNGQAIAGAWTADALRREAAMAEALKEGKARRKEALDMVTAAGFRAEQMAAGMQSMGGVGA